VDLVKREQVEISW